jgi:hypothetical protein
VDVTAKIIPQKPVSFQTASHSTSAVRLTTGEDGSLALKLREAGKYQISISIVGCVPVNLGEFDLKEGETLEIKEPVKLDKGLAVDALVKDSAGKPVENAVVIAQPVARGKRVVSSTSFLAQEW